MLRREYERTNETEHRWMCIRIEEMRLSLNSKGIKKKQPIGIIKRIGLEGLNLLIKYHEWSS
jgi:hypothetical protein